MANEYISSTELKATLTLTGQTYADADIADALEAASRGIDQMCGRRFYRNSSDETRYFTPTNALRLKVPDLSALTTFKTDPDGDGVFNDTWTLNTDFVLEPLNAAIETAAEPWRYVIRHPRGSYYFPTGYPRSVQIVGKFGWAAAPPAIIEATTILATKLLRRAREAPFGIVSVGIDIGSTTRIAQTDPDVRFLVGPYMDRSFA